jgi:hypothetical protein
VSQIVGTRNAVENPTPATENGSRGLANDNTPDWWRNPAFALTGPQISNHEWLFHFVGACQLSDLDYSSSLSAEQMQPTVRTSKRDLFPMDAQLHTQKAMNKPSPWRQETTQQAFNLHFNG